MIKIGVISDTHLSMPSKELGALTSTGGLFEDVSMVLHAGDITSLEVLYAFAPKKVAAVQGNMDSFTVGDKYPRKDLFSVEGVVIGLIHGWGSRSGLEERILPEFPNAHVIVYGHTHTPANHVKNGKLLFNPGSYTTTHTVGLLTLDKGKAAGTILNV